MGVFDRLPPMDHMRSEKMCFVQLIMPAESSRLAVTYLGELGLLQFKDVSAPSLSVASPCYLTASGFLARIYLNPASRVVISLPAPLARVTLCTLLDLALGRGRIGELVFDLRCHSIPVWRAFHV